MPRFTTALVSSLLLLTGAAATHGGHHATKNKDAQGNELEQRNFHEARHSPFFVHNSKELNRALAILEHESQDDQAHRRREGKWGKDEDEDEAESRRRRNNYGYGKDDDAEGAADRRRNDKKDKRGKDKERDFLFGRIEIVKAGDYQLDREFIFSDGFKLELEGLHRPKAQPQAYGDAADAETEGNGHKHHHHHHHVPQPEPGQDSAVVIHAAANHRHFTFDDHAVLKARDLTFADGGCEKEGFYGGSMLFVNRASSQFERVHFSDNKAWVGGAIFAENACRLDFHRGSFVHNFADRKGGAVAIEEEREKKQKKNGHHDHKAGAGRNGKIKHDDEKGDDFFSSGNADSNNHHGRKNKKGKRITRVHFARVFFKHNRADLGGALFNGGSRTDVEGSKFVENKARLGGAIYNNHRGRLLVRDTSFLDNKATAKGGAIFNSGRLWIVCSRFAGNEAPLGCDVFNNGEMKCTASTDVKVEGHGEGYCHSCVQPATAGPTMKSTPMRRVKKAEKVEKKEKHEKGGLFGGAFDKHGKEDKEEEERTYYDYYSKGASTAFDRWNGNYYGAWDEEEAAAHNDYSYDGEAQGSQKSYSSYGY